MLTFALGNKCAGGNHYHVDVTEGRRTARIRVDHNELKEPLSADEFEQFARDYLRLLAEGRLDDTIDGLRARLR